MRKLSLLLGVAVLTLTSCSKNDSNTTPATDASVLIKTMGSGTSPEIFTYNGNHIVSIVGSDGKTTNYTYTGDLITTITGPLVAANGIDTYKMDYTYDSNSRLISEVSSSGSGTAAFSINGKREYSYNADGTVTGQNFGYNDGTYTLSGISKYTFANGNIVRMENSTPDGNNNIITVCEFDSKNNPYYNITGFAKLFQGAMSSKNNITKATVTYGSTTDVSTYVYIYNNQGYPLTIQSSDVKDSEVPKVSNTIYTY